MMHMRPFQIILITVFAVLAIVGLIVFSMFKGFGGGAGDVGPVVIWGTLPETAVTDAITNLTRGQKQFSSVTYVEKPAGTFDNDLANALAAGTGPDMVIVNQEQLLTEAPKMRVIPFTSSFSQRNFLDSYLAIDQIYITTSGTYAVPLVVDPLVLYYNRAILSSVGVATPPATWEAVTGLAPLITKQSGGQSVSRSTIAFGSYGNVTNARAILSLLFLQAGSSITQDTSFGVRSTLGTPPTSANPGVAPAEAAVNFYTQFANPAKTTYSWNPSLVSSRQAFISGDLALYVGFASEEASLRAANPNLDFDMAPIPQSGVGSTRKTYGLAYAFLIPKVSAHPDGAFATALGLTGAGVLPSFSLSVGMAPAERSLLTSNPNDAYASIYYPEALNATGWLSPAPAATDAVFSAMITNVTTGRFDTPQALTAADQSLNAAMP